MDQGPTLRQSHELVSSNLIALCVDVEWTGVFQRIPGLLLAFTGHARAFCANFLRLSTSRSLVNLFLKFFIIPRAGDHTAQNIKTTVRLVMSRGALGSWYLPCSCLGLFGWPRDESSKSSYNRDQTLGLRSDLPTSPFVGTARSL